MKTNSYRPRVCVVGLWHLGCVYASCLAKLGYAVVGADEDPRVVETLRNGKSPIFEPGLEDLIASGIANDNLSFSHEIAKSVENATYVVIAYDTPVDAHDNVDISVILRTTGILRDISRRATIVVSSQVPVGTCDHIAHILADSGADPELAYVPENLRLGQAIERFMNPDVLVIGAKRSSTTSNVRALFAPIPTRIIEMDLRSAEMTKHALNSFLATSISFANEIGNLCDLVGADALKVAEALKCDSRIGPKALLRPGLGFAGGTLARDLKVLQKTGNNHAYDTKLIDGVLGVNELQIASIVDKLGRLVGNLQGKVVAVLGLTYKAGTNTLRRSAALEVIDRLRHEGASVMVFDPHVSKSDVASGSFLLCDDAYSACRDASALLILNDWPEFTNLDFEKIRHLMKEPFLFDAQNLLDPKKMTKHGISYVGIGRGLLEPKIHE